MNIREAAVRYLENRPRTCTEMKRRLTEKGFEKEEIEKTVEELISLGLLNDREYVNMYINYGFSKGKGIRLIKYELYEKGISSEDIDEGISEYEEEYGYDFSAGEKERAMAYALKICEDGSIDEKTKARLARRLSSKGFESRVIYSVINELACDAGDGDETV